MASFGAKYIQFAPMKEEPADTLPKYNAKISLGALSKAELTVNSVSGEQYGDDVLQEKVDEFVSGSLAVETCDLSLENEKTIFGATAESEEIINKDSDQIPYGGIAYIKVMLVKGVKSYRGTYLPKCKAAALPADSAATKAGSITLGNAPVTFTVFASNTGEWRERKEFATEIEAKQWCDSKLTTSV